MAGVPIVVGASHLRSSTEASRKNLDTSTAQRPLVGSTDYNALEDSPAIHFAIMGSLAGLRVICGLGISPDTDERLAAGATAVVLIERVD